MKAVPLIILDQVVYSNLKKYIWYSDFPEQKKDSEELFRYLLQNKIYVEGFATDCKDLVGTDKFCKPIVDISYLGETEAVVFLAREYGEGVIANSLMKTVYRVNPVLDARQAVIWGTGSNGKTAYKMLTESGIEVKCFIDKHSRSGKAETINGIPIYDLGQLDKLDDNEVLIEAYEKYYEMERVIEEKYPGIIKRFYCDIHSVQIYYRGYEDEKILFNLIKDQNDFYKLQGKNVKIYGTGEDAVELSRYLKLMDFDFTAFLSDSIEGNSAELDGYRVMPVEEILYEKNYAIWVLCDEIEKAQKKLKDLGVCFALDIVPSMKQLLMMDINMGHIYSLNGENYAGMVVYGQERQRNYKIAILGGSTTDGTIEHYKCWPQFLYELLQCSDITIYNAGVSGYVSGAELIRLVRDILPMNPDMVIVYDGVNDSISEQCGSTPYAFYYAQTIYKFAAKHIEDGYLKKNNIGEIPINYGMVCNKNRQNNNRFGNWLRNIEAMEAICHSKNIIFYSFLQPMLLSKYDYNETEKNMAEKYEDEYSYMTEFRKLIKRYAIEESHSYIKDLSHIYDEIYNVYYDSCHVHEFGNKIIASEIYKHIAGIISTWKRKLL